MNIMKKVKRILLISAIVLLTLVVLYLTVGFVLFKIDERERIKNLDLSGDTITITEEEYVNYLEELYIHSEKYIGKFIVIEGLYDYVEEDGIRYHFVGREIEEDEPCEEDHEHIHIIGLEFLSDDILPERGIPIQVKGVLTTVEEAGELFLILDQCSITIISNG